MSLQIVVAASVGAIGGAFLPRIACRLAVPFGTPPRPACADCSRSFPAGPAGWVRVGAACRCAGRRPAPAVRAPAERAPARTVPVAGPAVGSAARALVAAAPTVLASALACGLLAGRPALLPAALAGVLLAVIDLRCLRLPDRLVALLGVLVSVPAVLVAVTSGPHRLVVPALAAVLLGAAYLVIWLLPGRGLGLGDVKLAAVLGLALGQAGWPAVLLGAVLPHLINGPVALGLLLARRAGRRTALPFGPALLGGALIVLAATTP